MKRVVLGLLLSFVGIISVFSQLDLQLSQYMFHSSSFNPAAVGESGLVQVTGQHRSQWLGMPNGGKTTLFSINTPLKIGNSLHGLGFRVMTDEVGLFTNETFHLQYAFKKKNDLGVFSIGSDVGLTSLGFSGDSVGFNNKAKNTIGAYHELTSDPIIPTTAVVGMSLDLSVAAFFSTTKFYTGVSYQHLNNPKVLWGETMEFQQFGSLYVTGGYNYVLQNKKYVIKPSFLYKTNFNVSQFDLSTRIEYDSKYWGGLTYRLEDAIVILAGINVAGGFSIGASYDLPTSKIINASFGSLEVVMLYSFEYVSGKRTNKYKSIRIL